MKFRKKPIIIEATQWHRNGDHPHDYTESREAMEGGVQKLMPGSYFRENKWEGAVVRYFRRPDVEGTKPCEHCGLTMHDHGWIDTLEGGHIVCPGDWVITGVKGERYPCKPDIFSEIYDLA